MDPCGTPHLMGIQDDLQLSISINIIDVSCACAVFNTIYHTFLINHVILNSNRLNFNKSN